jgi:TorA maturation chaperone TorD
LPIDAALRQRLLDEDSLMARQSQTMDHISKVVETLSWLRASKGSDYATLMNSRFIN